MISADPNINNALPFICTAQAEWLDSKPVVLRKERDSMSIKLEPGSGDTCF